MRTRSVICLAFASAATICAANSTARADHFTYSPLDEKAGHMHYRIVDKAGTTILVVRSRAEYASIELRAQDISERLNQALDNLHTHEDLYLEVQWHHAQPAIHQVSRDGTVHFVIVAVTPGDVLGAKQRGGPREAVELARNWLDRIDEAIGSSKRVEETQAGVTEARPSSQEPEANGPHHEGATGTEAPEPGHHPPERKVRSGILLKLEPSDSAVYLDDSPISFSGTAPIPASPGRHLIDFVRPGYRSFGKEIEVQEGKILTVEVRLEPEEAEPR